MLVLPPSWFISSYCIIILFLSLFCVVLSCDFLCCWARTQTGIIHHTLSVTNITGSGFGHNLDVVVLKLPEFILLASGCEVEGRERKHLWGLVLPPSWSRGWRNPWHRPSDEVAGVLTAQLPPRRRLKPFHGFLPPSLSCSTAEHMLFKNIWSATKLQLFKQWKH